MLEPTDERGRVRLARPVAVPAGQSRERLVALGEERQGPVYPCKPEDPFDLGAWCDHRVQGRGRSSLARKAWIRNPIPDESMKSSRERSTTSPDVEVELSHQRVAQPSERAQVELADENDDGDAGLSRSMVTSSSSPLLVMSSRVPIGRRGGAAPLGRPTRSPRRAIPSWCDAPMGQGDLKAGRLPGAMDPFTNRPRYLILGGRGNPLPPHARNVPPSVWSRVAPGVPTPPNHSSKTYWLF